MIPASLVLVALVAVSGPFFPPSLLLSGAHADTRRCAIGATTTESDCALIGAQWVVTTAGAVASAHPVNGRLHVRIGDTEYTVEQLVYHPKWDGGVKFDVTLLKLADRVPEFPMLPLPGEFPLHVERVARHALPQREWIAQTIGPSPVWDDQNSATLANKSSSLLSTVRSIMDAWSGRTSND